MKNKAYIQPTKASMVVALIALGILFLFGLVFLTILLREGGGIGVIFLSFWLLMILVIAGAYIYNLRSKKAAKGMGAEITFPAAEPSGDTANGFEPRLRQLESLRKDGLITDAEYQQKRSEIMNSKW